MKIKLNNKTFCTIVVYLTINSFFSFSQDRTKTSGEPNRTIDSLEIVLQTAKEDTTRINTLNTLAWELKYNNPDTANKTLNTGT